MAIADRKEREREKMKRQILDSAMKLFLELGYEKTSIRSIAEDIEYSPGTIYLYYKDKSDLLYALQKEAFVEFAKVFVNVQNIQDPFERLLKLGYEYFCFGLSNPELYELMFLLTAPMDSLDFNEELWEEGRGIYKMLENLIKACQKEGHFKNADTSGLAIMIWATVHGLATIHLRRRNTMFGEEEREKRIEAGYNSLVQILKSI